MGRGALVGWWRLRGSWIWGSRWDWGCLGVVGVLEGLYIDLEEEGERLR